MALGLSPHRGQSPACCEGQGLQVSCESSSPWFSMLGCELCVTQDHNICKLVRSYPLMQSRQLTRCPQHPCIVHSCSLRGLAGLWSLSTWVLDPAWNRTCWRQTCERPWVGVYMISSVSPPYHPGVVTLVSSLARPGYLFSRPGGLRAHTLFTLLWSG